MECINHKPRYLCYSCNNNLFCYICIDKHINLNPTHQYDHADDIRYHLVNTYKKKDDNNNSKDNNSNLNHKQKQNHWKKEIDKLWNVLKNSSTHLNVLEGQEKEISNKFREQHELLVIEEHKIKKPILNEINNIREEINQYIDQLKLLFNILNLTKSSSSITSNDELYLEKDEVQVEVSEDEDDNDDSLIYENAELSVDEIISSIKESESFIQFMKSNKTTFLNHKFVPNSEEIKDSFNNDIDLITLDSIQKYKKHKKQLSVKSGSIASFSLKTNRESIRLLKELASKLITIYTPKILTIMPNRSTMIGMPGTNSTKLTYVNANYNASYTLNSGVVANGKFYIFGGHNPKDTKYQGGNQHYAIFKIRENQSIQYERQGRIFTSIEGGWGISVAFDGKNYIYLTGGYNDKKEKYLSRIDRYNIRSGNFEKCHHFGFGNYVTLSFFYNGLLYALPCNQNSIHSYNPLNKSIDVYLSRWAFPNLYIACTDGQGNVYILSEDRRFTKYNVISKLTITLAPFNGNFEWYSMIHSSHSEKISSIYLIGGKRTGNYWYSTEGDRWRSFAKFDDQYDRINYCSILID